MKNDRRIRKNSRLRSILAAGTVALASLTSLAHSQDAETMRSYFGTNEKHDDYGISPKGKGYDVGQVYAPEEVPKIEETKLKGRAINRHGHVSPGPVYLGSDEMGIPTITINSVGDCVSQLATYIRDSREAFESAISVLEGEFERGWLAPEKATEARESLNVAVNNYEKFGKIYNSIHYGRSDRRFKREVDFFSPDVTAKLVDKKTGEKVPHPMLMVDEFADFVSQYPIRGSNRNSPGGSTKKHGLINTRLTKAIEELDEIIRRNEQVEISNLRYVPFKGTTERIDEFLHSDGDLDAAEAFLGTFGVLGLGSAAIGIPAYILTRGSRRRKEEEAEAEESVKKELEKDPEPEEVEKIIDPWSISLSDTGGKNE